MIGDAARHDEVEVGEIRGDIECKAVARDPPRDPHSDGGQLGDPPGPFVDPDSRQPLDAPGRHLVIGGRADQHFFEISHVAAHVAPVGPQVQDRVAHQLPGPMVGHITAATRGIQRHPASLPRRLAGQHVRRLRVPAQGDDVRMLKQQQMLVATGLRQAVDEPLLEPEPFGVRQAAEPPGNALPGFDIRHQTPRSVAFAFCSVSLTRAM